MEPKKEPKKEQKKENKRKTPDVPIQITFNSISNSNRFKFNLNPIKAKERINKDTKRKERKKE